MTTVFVVHQGSYSDRYLDGIYDTIEAAMENAPTRELTGTEPHVHNWKPSRRGYNPRLKEWNCDKKLETSNWEFHCETDIEEWKVQ